MATGMRRNAEREARWRAAIARWAASELSVREFCRREGLGEPAFYAWRRTLAERDAAAENSARGETAGVAAGPPAFLPVGLVTAASAAGGGFALELRGGRTLRMPESLSARRLAAIVRAIESEVAR